ncbi:carbohydrate ABC transporter permease [Kribbella sp. NPDC051770]|uniref:carbohydrate ABC transporter permease n=1 Tax=Kribbella sp. NPDC051770 TaxID=3155413 RepID=UPI003438590B
MRAAGRTATYLWLTVASVVMVFPLYYVFVGAFVPTSELVQGVRGLFPAHPTLDNFRDATTLVPLGRQFVNSVLVTLAQTTGQFVISVLSAYALVFCNLRAARALFLVILSTLMIPAESIIVANYLTISSLGLQDTLTAIFLPFLASAFEIFLLRQAFLSFPREIHEAAKLDGVGHLRFIGAILLPLTKPVATSVILISAINAWNGYFWPLLVTDSPTTRTVQLGIAQLNDAEASNLGVVLAGDALVTLPVLLLVLLGQRFLATGLTAGAIK